jgi:uncharacterized protein (TIGR00297 family)
MRRILSDISQKYQTHSIANQSNIQSILDFLNNHRGTVRLAIGFVVSSTIGYVAWRKRSLSKSGFVGAILSGTLTTACGGYGQALLLVGFFVSSSALSRRPRKDGRDLDAITAKGGKRDLSQAAANGGVSTAIALLGTNERHRLPYLGSLAAVTGDTWATEIGIRSPEQPRDVLTLRPVPVGASGGVSFAGTMASAVGGVCMGGLAAFIGLLDPISRPKRRQLVITGIVSGIVGSLVDSVIGATLQERRWCDACGQATERLVHTCGQPTRITGGIPGLNNDAVNFLCSLSGASVGWIVERLMRH